MDLAEIAKTLILASDVRALRVKRQFVLQIRIAAIRLGTRFVLTPWMIFAAAQ
jgi:hypothetical protein